MTWILPKQLHISAFALDTAALISDSSEQSQVCEQSLLVRSKASPARTWSLKWKRDTWTQHLSGRILKPSLGPSFLAAWTSSLEVIPASPSPAQASDSEPTILGTSGQQSEMVFDSCGPDSAFSRTSRDTLRLDSPQSSATWKKMVTEQRGEYSQRLRSARLTSGNGCSSWPTASARDWKDSSGMATEATNPDGSLRTRTDQLARAVYAAGPAVPASPSTHGSRQERQNLGKLNPRWVETLMGLPVGWTMPSCASPVTIEPMNCASSATASFPPPPNEPSMFSTKG